MGYTIEAEPGRLISRLVSSYVRGFSSAQVESSQYTDAEKRSKDSSPFWRAHSSLRGSSRKTNLNLNPPRFDDHKTEPDFYSKKDARECVSLAFLM